MGFRDVRVAHGVQKILEERRGNGAEGVREAGTQAQATSSGMLWPHRQRPGSARGQAAAPLREVGEKWLEAALAGLYNRRQHRLQNHAGDHAISQSHRLQVR